jgi:hypothetical protein
VLDFIAERISHWPGELFSLRTRVQW